MLIFRNYECHSLTPEATPCEAPSDDETFFALLPPAAAPIITITAITITTIGQNNELYKKLPPTDI